PTSALPLVNASSPEDMPAEAGTPVGVRASARMSYKFVINCESRLFQRPDDAIHRGLDKQTESDLARHDNFISNFQPLTSQQAREIVEKVTEFDQFTEPMKRMLREAAGAGTGYVVCSAIP